MPITITITDPTPAQIAALFGISAAATPAAEPKAEEKPKRQPKAKEAAMAEPEEPTEAPAAEVPSLDDVRAAAQKIVAANGRDALADRLAEFGAVNLSALPEDRRAEFIAGV